MSFAFAPPKARRRPSLTPMIDVVFLLLVFFMLAARFGQEGAIEMQIAGSGAAQWEGPPRLVELLPDGLRLNGVTMSQETMLQTLETLLPSDAAPTLLRPADGVPLQALVDLLAVFETAGIANIAVIAP